MKAGQEITLIATADEFAVLLEYLNRTVAGDDDGPRGVMNDFIDTLKAVVPEGSYDEHRLTLTPRNYDERDVVVLVS